MGFRERYGYVPVRQVVETQALSAEARSGVWNVLWLLYFQHERFIWGSATTYSDVVGHKGRQLADLVDILCLSFWHKPINFLPPMPNDRLSLIQKEVIDGPWYNSLTIIEIILKFLKDDEASESVNKVFKQHLSGYRFVEGNIAPVHSEEEIESIESAIHQELFGGAAAHLRSALSLLSDYNAPDPRNSIKESISAVESMAKVVTGEKQGTLGKLIEKMEENGFLHPAFKKGLSNLYGWSSDHGGIRHGIRRHKAWNDVIV